MIDRIAIKQRPVFLCDNCTKKMDKPFIETHDVPNEGMSEIRQGGESFDVGNQRYCSFECLFEDIKDSLS